MNKEVVLDRLKEMEDNLVILDKLAKYRREDFVGQPEVYKLAERCLQLAIESILDVTHYILAQKNLPRAEGADAISGLGQYYIIPADFAEQIRPMAGFRNILVHEYLKIDRNKVYDYTQRLNDFRKFAAYVVEFLEKD